MIISKIEKTNNYIIKLLGKKIDIYNPLELEEITKIILKKITKNNKLKSLILLEIYIDKLYGTIIILKNYNKLINTDDEIEVKINIHTNNPFLYKINYINIKNKNINKENIYYYQNNFYLEIKDNINTKDYFNILENTEIVYENSDEITNKGIKIKI